jgi:hypothetical protein
LSNKFKGGLSALAEGGTPAALPLASAGPGHGLTSWAAPEGLFSGDQLASSYKYAGGNPGSWYDASKYDPNNMLAGINSINGVYMMPGRQAGTTPQGGEGGGDNYDPGEAPYIVTSNGTIKYLSGDANSGYTFQDNYNDPSGKSEKDQLGVTYKYDPSTGTAVPVKTQGYYSPSDWVGTYRPVATYVGAVLGAGALGAGLAGAGASGATGATAGAAAGTGSAGMTSAELAALHSASGYGASTAAEAGFAGLGGTTAGGAAGLSAAEIAALPGAYGSAPLYSGVGSSGAGAGSDSIVNGSTAATSSGGPLSNLGVKDAISAVKAVAPLLGAAGGGGSGSSGGTAAMPAGSPSTQGALGLPASRYAYDGFHADSAPAPRLNHTMGPSGAVNMSDPSAALFGYGTLPTYYKPPVPKAEGGSIVDDDYGNPLQLGGSTYDPDPYAGGVAPAYMGPGTPGAGAGTDALPPSSSGMTDSIKDWWDRLQAGDKRAKGQLMLGVGGLGMLASLLGKKNRQMSAGELTSRLQGNRQMNASGYANMDNYFNAPASRYVAPVVTVGGRAYADGGDVPPHSGPGAPLMPSTEPMHFDSRHHGPLVPDDGHGGQDDRVPAWLGGGEYVFDADTVAALGDGNNAHGARQLDAMREAIREHKRSAPADSIPPRALSPLQYLKKGK